MAEEIDKLRAVLERDPTDETAFNKLCEIAEKANDYDYLAELFTFRAQVLGEGAQAAELYLKAGDIYIHNVDNLTLGVRVLLEGFECDRTHVALGERIAGIYRDAEDWEAALTFVEQRVEALSAAADIDDKNTTLSALHTEAGEILQKIYDDDERALKHYKLAIERSSKNLVALFRARAISYQKERYEEASHLCELEIQAEEDDERRAGLWRELSHIHAKHLFDNAEAVAALKQALEIKTDDDGLKSDLAHAIALVPQDESERKDREWAVDYFIDQGSDAEVEPDKQLELGELALRLMPQNTRAIQFMEAKSTEFGVIERLVELYLEIIGEISELADQAPIIRRLATVLLEDMGSPIEALDWMTKLKPLGVEEDLKAIAQISTGVEIRASQVPAASIPPNQGNGVEALPAGEGHDGDEEGNDSLEDASAAGTASVTPTRPSRIPAGRSKYVVPAGMTTEQAVNQLHQYAESARRKGDDPSAEQHMVCIIDVDPYDHKATVFLERRFRVQQDWTSLRDLLLLSSGAPQYDLAEQTVRLREAARISEEHLYDLDKAIDVWQQIRTGEPKMRDASDALLRLLSKRERWEEVLEIIEDEAVAAKSSAQSVAGYRRMADIYRIRLGDSEKAAEAFHKILELSPDDSEALDALDEIYLREQNYEKLVDLLKNRVEITRDPTEKRNYLLRAASTLDQPLGKSQEAYQLLEEILSIVPGDDEALEIMERMDRIEERWGQLIHIKELRAKAASDPEKAAEFLRTRALLIADHIPEPGAAIKAWRQVLEVVPGDRETLAQLAIIHRELGNWQNLLEILDKQIEAAADNLEKAELYRQKARVFDSKLDNIEEAVASWQRVTELEEDIESLGALANYYESVGEWQTLVEILERQLPHVENDVARAGVLCRKAAVIEEQLNDRNQASLELHRAINDYDSLCTLAYQRLAAIYFHDEDYEKAVDALENQIANTHEKEPLKELQIKLGNWTRDHLNNLTRSIEAFQQAYQIDSEDESLIQLLDDAYSQAAQWDNLLKLVHVRFQRADAVADKLELLVRGAVICEEKLNDFKRAWSWYKLAYESAGDLAETISTMEQAAHRMELWNELNEFYGILTRRESEPAGKVRWWFKIADVFDQKLNDPGQALEAVLRAFGLTPENIELLDRVDELSIKAQNWDRLATVYQVLERRLASADEKIALLLRYTNVLLEKGKEPSKAFDVLLRAFELDPHRDDLLETVEQVAGKSERWKDLSRVYSVCSRISESRERKTELKMREVACLRDKLEDMEGALVATLEALRIDPLDDTVQHKVWHEISVLEDRLDEADKGQYWNNLVELYHALIDSKTYRKDTETKVGLFLAIAEVCTEKLQNTQQAFEALKAAQQVNPLDEYLADRLEAMAGDNYFWEDLIVHYADILDEAFEMAVAAMIHRRRARILEEELDRLEDAAEHYWQIIQLDPSDLSNYDKLIAHYEKAEKFNELVNLYERQLDYVHAQDTKKTILFTIAAVWENQIGNLYEAKDWYEQILMIWPDEEDAKAGVARIVRVSRVPDDVLEEDIHTADELAHAPESDFSDESDGASDFEAAAETEDIETPGNDTEEYTDNHSEELPEDKT